VSTLLRLLIMVVLLSTVLSAAWLFNTYRSTKLPAEIAEANQLEWNDLLPQSKPLIDTLADTPINVRYDLGFIGKVLADADAEVISREGAEYRNAMEVLEKHRAAGIDVDKLLAEVSGRDQEIARRGEAVNSSLDGKLVRLPGYALPLQTVEEGVSEFLLVPFVGACIHVPPPPPNQVVLAQLQSVYKLKDLYDPVMITGHLRAQQASTELYLVDGEAEIPMGYSMQVMHVEAMD